MGLKVPQISRILHPTDMSENARRALLYSAGFAHRFAAKITVLHVLDEASPNTKIVLGLTKKLISHVVLHAIGQSEKAQLNIKAPVS